MPGTPALWLRHETAPTERRTPVVPADAASLVAAGTAVIVEESAQRAFPVHDYAAVGCAVVAAGSWPDAPPDAVIVGLKEPASHPFALRHRHVFFGHAYKGQAGAARLLSRFVAGGGTLLDLESLTDEAGRRLAAFGAWAGYAGAALAVLYHRGELPIPLRTMTRPELDQLLRRPAASARALVIGALGRCGRGACEALTTAGQQVTRWDMDETRQLDVAALLDHDILVNAVYVTEPGPAFLTAADLDRAARERRLTVVSDVSCDVTSACNRLPINAQVTSWAQPVRRLRTAPRPLDVLAIDNLPSLLPKEASSAFSADLLPWVKTLPAGGPGWSRCQDRFREACRRLDTNEGVSAR